MAYVYDPGDSPWSRLCHREYKETLATLKPTLRCVTFLLYSGIRDAGYSPTEYFAPKMVHSYARAFQVHQRPLKTAPVHVFFMTNLPYLVYLPLVAMPVDIVAHTLQFFWGESMFFFEGGIYFPYYMALHWFVLALAYCAIYVRFIPALWPSYFRFFRKVLAVNDVEYRRTLCTKRTPITRVLHFAAFLSLLLLSIHVLSESYCVALVKRAAVALVYVLVFFGITASMGMGFGRLFVGLDCGGKK